MARIYDMADTVEEIATQQISMYHPELATARIKYVFVDQASKKNGRPVRGKARKLGGVLEFLLDADFLLEVAHDCWNESTPDQKEALVDHLLESCTGEEDDETGEMKWSMRTPDVQEFHSILVRHGAWHEALTNMVDVAQRLNIESRVQEVQDSEVVQREA